MSDAKNKPLDHSDYVVPGTALMNFSAWSRDNIPKEPPRFKVGDLVYLKRPLVVVAAGEDCDGTPLFAVAQSVDERRFALRGYSNDALEAAPAEEE